MGLGFKITGNQALDFFIMQSAENRDKVIESLSQSDKKYINDILMDYRLDSRDFTDEDWKIVSQYLWRED